MTGQALYELWCRALLEQDTGADAWEDIEASFQMAWNRTAELLWGGE
jgi:hypothetical protein